MKMVRLLVVLIFSTLIMLTTAPDIKFCSPVCGTRCQENIFSRCDNSCQDSAWIVSDKTCTPNTALGWKLYDSTPDYNGGTLTVTGAASTKTCDDMKYYGYVTAPSIISISTSGITVPYFAMKVYAGIIAIDVDCQDSGKSSKCGSGPNPQMQGTTQFDMFFNDP